MLMRMFVGPGDNIINLTPSFGMYTINTELCGGTAVSVPRDHNFDIDIEGVKLAITPRTKAIMVCSPNNPSGNLASEAEVRALLDTGLLVVVDEAYFEFCGRTVMPLLEEYPNLVVLRPSASGRAGRAAHRSRRDAPRPGPNHDVGQAALQRQPGRRSRAYRLAGRYAVASGAGQRHRVGAGTAWPPRSAPSPRSSPTLRRLIHPVPATRRQRAAGVRRLCNRGIFLRHWSSPRLRDCIRASVGLAHETDAVVAAISELTSPLSLEGEG